MFKKNKNAFTLLEIVVVCIILAVIASVALPNMNVFLDSGRANDAQNGLLSIYGGQLDRFSRTGNYYQSPGCAAATIVNDAAGIANPANLGVVLTVNNVNYCCGPAVARVPPVVPASNFRCYANVGGRFTMAIDGRNPVPNINGAFTNAARNPLCIAGACPAS